MNLAAVHYHFGSKEEMLDALVIRKAGPVNEERLALLTRFEAEAAPNPAPVEKVLEAFLAPPFLERERSPLFVRVMGRMYAEGLMPSIVAKHFQPISLAVLRGSAGGAPARAAGGNGVAGPFHDRHHGAHACGVPPAQEAAPVVVRRIVRFLGAGFRAEVSRMRWLILFVAPLCFGAELQLSLKRAVEIAVSEEGNTAVQLSGEAVKQAQSRSAQARAALLPDLSASVGETNRTANLAAMGIRFTISDPGLPDSDLRRPVHHDGRPRHRLADGVRLQLDPPLPGVEAGRHRGKIRRAERGGAGRGAGGPRLSGGGPGAMPTWKPRRPTSLCRWPS